MNSWKEGLSGEQIEAASYKGSHARLLAGPSTGKTKTITHRVLALILDYNVDPRKILILTFTRIAAYNLKQKIKKILEPLKKEFPFISTLHSFALRQLLKNSARIITLPQPLRIADDWEERWIIEEDLKIDLFDHLKTILPDIGNPIDKVRSLFNQLSADWETLKIELDESQRICSDAKFIGAWTNHRNIFGYTLRAELVYQLKRALNQDSDFKLESGFEHVLIDEYQDLNACDLAIVEELEKKRCELFVAGDDDQSIYGFRYADPNGIRIFPKVYRAKELKLKTCYRCDKSILDIGEFIANLDVYRLPKKTEPKEGSSSGEIHLQCYKNQDAEATGVSKRCKEILNRNASTEILVLMRSDFHGVISKTLIEALNKEGVQVAVETEESPLDSDFGRYILSLLRLINNPFDSLSWRTVLQLRCNGVGSDTQKVLRDKAQEYGKSYFDILLMLKDGTCKIQRGDKINEKVNEMEGLIKKYRTSEKTISERIHEIIIESGEGIKDKDSIDNYLQKIIIETGAENLEDLLVAISASIDSIEQELTKDKVNIMTMHKAKGLSADVVFILGAEKQFIPGKNIGARAEDERRLLYVSLTRARHELIITYCNQRLGQQKYTGSESGNSKREITPFLKNAPLKVEQIS